MQVNIKFSIFKNNKTTNESTRNFKYLPTEDTLNRKRRQAYTESENEILLIVNNMFQTTSEQCM